MWVRWSVCIYSGLRRRECIIGSNWYEREQAIKVLSQRVRSQEIQISLSSFHEIWECARQWGQTKPIVYTNTPSTNGLRESKTFILVSTYVDILRKSHRVKGWLSNLPPLEEHRVFRHNKQVPSIHLRTRDSREQYIYLYLYRQYKRFTRE